MMCRLILFICLLLFSSIFMPIEAQNSKQPNFIIIDGIIDDIEVYRDKYGTPYVIAKNEQDLLFAQGYMQAMDRLFQLDGTRLLAQGRISELISSDFSNYDYWHRRIGFGRLAEKQMELLSPESAKVLEAFSNGINAFIENSAHLPVEYQFLGFKPEPWTPYDSLCVTNLISWWLSIGMDQEEFYYDLIHAFGEEMTSKLFVGIPSREDINNSIIEKDLLKNQNPGVTIPALSSLERLEPHGNVVRGTNVWVLMPEKTANNKPILANDPHLNLFTPSIWYEIGLFCPEWSSVGVVFPGMPFHQIGTNGKIAWGAANFPVDVQDLYVETVNPENKMQYEFDGEWVDYKVNSECFKFKDGSESNFEFLESINGPVIRHFSETNLSLAWSGFQPSDSLQTFHKLVRSENIDDFYESLRYFRATPQHFLAFDLNNDVIHVQPGLIPIREGFNGDYPKPGNSSEFLWSGFYDYDKIPVIRNPIEGFVNNSNNFPPENWGFDLGTTFCHPSRYDRTREILLERDDFIFDDMVKIQTDLLNPVARDLLPLMLSKIDLSDFEDFSDKIDLLVNWDYFESPDSIAATIYNEWWIELPKHLFNRKLGMLAVTFRDYMDQKTYAMINLLKNGESSEIFEWLGLGNEYNLRQLCRISLQLTFRELEKKYGTDKTNWEWGKVHKTFFVHPGKINLPFLGVGKGHGVGGSRYTMNVTHFFPSSRYDADFGASYRIVASIDDNNRIYAKSVIPPGNTGFIGSPHSNDQMNMWISGELKKLYVYEDELSDLQCSFIIKSK